MEDADLKWRKASYSSNGGGNCVEVADGTAPAPGACTVVDTIAAVVPVVEVDAVFAVATARSPSHPEAYNLAPHMAPTARRHDSSETL
jgi:hypothetical protein